MVMRRRKSWTDRDAGATLTPNLLSYTELNPTCVVDVVWIHICKLNCCVNEAIYLDCVISQASFQLI